MFLSEREAVVQEYIDGKEVTCGVLDRGFRESAFALLPTEIVPRKQKFFDYEEKYSASGAYEITPARLPDLHLSTVQKIALFAHKLFGCRGYSRTDIMFNRDGAMYILEINTLPGLTEQSLLPKSAQMMGISFSELLDHIIYASLI